MFKAANNNDETNLIHSKCSENSNEAENSLYKIIQKTLRNQVCAMHNQKYQYLYKHKLLCTVCFEKEIKQKSKTTSSKKFQKYRQFYNLQTILSHPVLLLTDEKELIQHPIQIVQLLLRTYKPLFAKKSDFSIQKQLLISFTNRIKTRISSLCDEILALFTDLEQHLTKQSQYKEDLKDMTKIYEEQFLELFGQKYVNGTKQEIQAIFQEYTNSNQNPFQKMLVNLDETMSHLSQSPVIDIAHLLDIYTTITDERLWKCNKIVQSHSQMLNQTKEESCQMIFINHQTKLQQQYTLQFNQNNLILKKQDAVVDSLDINLDSLYQFSKYRLIGVNYNKIYIVSYLDRLRIQEFFQLEGCTDLLPFDKKIVAIGNEKLAIIDLQTKYIDFIGVNYCNLKYVRGKPQVFQCQNQQQKQVYWNLKTNQILKSYY